MKARWSMLAIFVLALLLPLAAAAKTPAKAPEIRWLPLSYKQFAVEDQVGSLTSCAYRLVEPGKPSEFVWEDKVKVAVSRNDTDELVVEMYVAKGEIAKLKRKAVVAAFEEATGQCYERLTE